MFTIKDKTAGFGAKPARYTLTKGPYGLYNINFINETPSGFLVWDSTGRLNGGKPVYQTFPQGTGAPVTVTSPDQPPPAVTSAPAQPAVPLATGADVSNVPVYVTRNGRTYHSSACRFADIGFQVPMKQALDRGLKPCSSCLKQAP
jgi:hypothetical protein